MWTHENRGLYERRGGRYPSDLTDDEWALIGPLIPPAKHGGRPRTVDLREVMNGVPAAEVDGAQLFGALGVGRHAGEGPP
jgi:hypothetical protein